MTVAAGGELEVEVTNSAGRPSGPAAATHGGGFGVIGMRERVQALGGQLTAGPRPDGGWTVHTTIPLGAAPGPDVLDPSAPPRPGRQG